VIRGHGPQVADLVDFTLPAYAKAAYNKLPEKSAYPPDEQGKASSFKTKPQTTETTPASAAFGAIGELMQLAGSQRGTASTMELQPFQLLQGAASFDIVPSSLTETMQSLLRRAQDDANNEVCQEETTAYKDKKKLLNIKL
jgi:hypothetical protein